MTRNPRKSHKQWFDEVNAALTEARDNSELHGMWDTLIGDTNLFQLAPYACFRKRRLRLSEAAEEQLVRKALSIYFSLSGHKHQVRAHKVKAGVAFAQCYISVLVALQCLEEDLAASLIRYCTDRLDVPEPVLPESALPLPGTTIATTGSDTMPRPAKARAAANSVFV